MCSIWQIFNKTLNIARFATITRIIGSWSLLPTAIWVKMSLFIVEDLKWFYWCHNQFHLIFKALWGYPIKNNDSKKVCRSKLSTQELFCPVWCSVILINAVFETLQIRKMVLGSRRRNDISQKHLKHYLHLLLLYYINS